MHCFLQCILWNVTLIVYIYSSLHSNIPSGKQHELDATLACAIDTVLMNRSWIIGENIALWLLLTACDKVGYNIELSLRYMIRGSFVALLYNTYDWYSISVASAATIFSTWSILLTLLNFDPTMDNE